ncbi:unnamed protein product [Rhizoctonia solani]|uniref:Uncharacterized protein n=1 Tax=Rhizoctonia solani TaxID=456999 RepID=A0A8H3CWZ4_9AGAM|nr:unnamed protein product [Rhizoctonia solani]
MAPARLSLTEWQYWISLLQLLSGLYMIGYWAWGLSNVTPLLKDSQEELFVWARSAALQYSLWLAFGIVVAVNNTFILSVDIKRTNTYLGFNPSKSSPLFGGELHNQTQERTKFQRLFNITVKFSYGVGKGTYGNDRHWDPVIINELGRATFHIEISSTYGIISDSEMPPIWFLRGLEEPSNYSLPRLHDARTYVPGWVLRPGSHIDAEARLITRKRIKSSILKDIILNSNPAYHFIPLYPIAQSGSLNYPNMSIATGTIRVTSKPGFMYFRIPHGGLQDSASASDDSEVCDYIEDYRSGTILDVIGSVGGLFALLQAVHVLLFGRPLFWGLTGAKLITPFGLLGSCGSRGFRHRLKEEYHSTSVEDGLDSTLRIVKFLRDFVIDFGPADFDAGPPPSRGETESLTIVAKDGDAANNQTPLMQAEPNTMPVGQSANNAGKYINRGADQLNEMV